MHIYIWHSIYIFTRKAFVTIFPFSVVWSIFNGWFDGIRRTAISVSTLRENWRSLQRLMLPFARQMTFWVLPGHVYEAVKTFSLFLKCSLNVKDFRRKTEKGIMKVSNYPTWSQPRVQLPPDCLWEVLLFSLYPRPVKSCDTSQKWGVVCSLCPLCLGNLPFLNWSQHPLHVIALGLLPAFLVAPWGGWLPLQPEQKPDRCAKCCTAPLLTRHTSSPFVWGDEKYSSLFS